MLLLLLLLLVYTILSSALAKKYLARDISYGRRYCITCASFFFYSSRNATSTAAAAAAAHEKVRRCGSGRREYRIRWMYI